MPMLTPWPGCGLPIGAVVFFGFFCRGGVFCASYGDGSSQESETHARTHNPHTQNHTHTHKKHQHNQTPSHPQPHLADNGAGVAGQRARLVAHAVDVQLHVPAAPRDRRRVAVVEAPRGLACLFFGFFLVCSGFFGFFAMMSDNLSDDHSPQPPKRRKKKADSPSLYDESLQPTVAKPPVVAATRAACGIDAL